MSRSGYPEFTGQDQTTFAGDEIFRFCKDLKNVTSFEISDKIIDEIEAIILLLVSLRGTTRIDSIAAILLQYVKRSTSSSLYSYLSVYVSDMLTKQSGIEQDQYLDLITDIKRNWTTIRSSKFFQQISNLLSLVVVSGLCNVSDLTFKLGDFKIFEPNLYALHKDSFDLLDAIFGTVCYFFEHIYLCWKNKSIVPLLMSERDVHEIGKEYSTIISYWDLVQAGNLEKVAGICESEFDHRLELLASRVSSLMNSAKGFDAKLMRDKYEKLLLIKNDYVTLKISSGIRKAPFVLEFYGESNQGKTTCAEQLVDALLISQNLPRGKEFQASYNPTDKYMSSWKTDKVVLFIDDMANEKPSQATTPPTRAIIDICNNQPYYANMAELELKGKVFVEPSIVAVTTNVKHLDAMQYSNCPFSIQRRMHAVITVTVKDEFALIIDDKKQGVDTKKVRDYYKEHDMNPSFDDIWQLTVETAIRPSTDGAMRFNAHYKVLSWKGMELKNVSMKVVMQYLCEQFATHRENQNSILERMNRRDDVQKCPFEGCTHIKGFCDEHDKLCMPCKQAGLEDIAEDVTILLATYRNMWRMCRWIDFIPSIFFQVSLFRRFAMLYIVNRSSLSFYRLLCLWLICLLISLVCCVPAISVFMLVFCLTISLYVVRFVMDEYECRFSRRDIFVPLYRLRTQTKFVLGSIGIASLASFYVAISAYRQWRIMRQGSLEPKTQFDIDQRDAEENPWCPVIKRNLPITKLSKTVSAHILMQQVQKSLVYGTIHNTKLPNARFNGLFLDSNLILMPYHYFEEYGENLRCTLRKDNPDACGGKFCADLSVSAASKIPNTDLILCYCATGGSFPNLRKHLPLKRMPAVPFGMAWRSKTGEVLQAKGLTRPGIAEASGDRFDGGYYQQINIQTFAGLCGAILVSDTRGSVILGMHLGGIAGTKIGCYGAIYSPQIEDAIRSIKEIEGICLSGSGGNFQEEVLGVKIPLNEDLHVKSPVNFMPKNSQVEYLGRCVGRGVTKSDVKVTPISDILMDVCNSPNIYCAPKMNPDWYGWQKCLENLSIPGRPYPHDLLRMAIVDYKEPLLKIFRDPLWNNARPLTDHENLCGIPGKKFVDAIKLDTAIGYPLIGPKRCFVEELDPEPDKPNNRILDQTIMDEINRCEECYKRGERAYPIAKACKKDEILSKEKCRIFYGNALALTFLIRKYYLPLLRVLQMNPLVSECAVGINCHGPEWEEFHNHVYKFGKNRLFGGDYGKYDQKLPSQLLFAALRILIDFARECDYNEEDLRVMEAMTGDIVFAIISFNGDLIGLTEGTHISGNSLTVIMNGICGSLNMRCYYYNTYPYDNYLIRRKFRDNVAAMTYGDDNIGSVHPEEKYFTIKGFSKFLDKFGQVYTMPDKESELVEFLPAEEFEFLKRTSIYHDTLGVHVGALLEKSIFKSLHMFLRPKGCELTEDHACAINIDGALREWFNHGPEIFEKRRLEMNEVAARAGITHMCTMLDETYNSIVLDWKDKYANTGSGPPL